MTTAVGPKTSRIAPSLFLRKSCALIVITVTDASLESDWLCATNFIPCTVSISSLIESWSD